MKKILSLAFGICLLTQGISQNVTVKAMTLNIRSIEPDFNIRPFVQLILDENPDVVGFQEVEVRTSRMQQRDVVLEIAAATGMFSYFAPAYQKDDGEYGNAVLSRFPITASHYTELPIMKAGGGSDQRVGLVTELMLPGNFKMRLLNTHIDHRISPDKAYEQLQPMLTQNVTDGTTPIIFTGDFNADPYSPLITEIVKNFDNQTDDSGTFGADHGYIGSKLDYIFSYPKGKWKRIETRTLHSVRISDHYPVISILEYQK
ncbi:MAG: endonuclease/exonuclease/phosphatase family protein [Capnocytophaga sp.]|nr:endonuclease/exonuclease/phosphatase family protein [Capnocytophaga sp.]